MRTGKDFTMKNYEHINAEPAVVMQGGVTVAIDPQVSAVEATKDKADNQEILTFAKRIRKETAQAHRLAESTNFVKGILRGVMDMESFANMQAGMFVVYEAMEEELERHKDHPLVSQVYFEQLRRKEVLEQDMQFLYGDDWRDKIRMTPMRRKYIDRIREVSANDPALLVAHSYTRYLGDLSGGQVIAKIARRSLGLSGPDGLRFFEFEEIEDGKAFKEEYRNRLNQLEIDEVRSHAIIEEAKRVFALNQSLFEELEGSWIRAIANCLPRIFNRRQRA